MSVLSPNDITPQVSSIHTDRKFLKSLKYMWRSTHNKGMKKEQWSIATEPTSLADSSQSHRQRHHSTFKRLNKQAWWCDVMVVLATTQATSRQTAPHRQTLSDSVGTFEKTPFFIVIFKRILGYRLMSVLGRMPLRFAPCHYHHHIAPPDTLAQISLASPTNSIRTLSPTNISKYAPPTSRRGHTRTTT